MGDNTTYSKMGLFHVQRKSMGFLGRYLIEGSSVKELEKDFWADNTKYQIYPMSGNQKQFEDYCFSRLAAIAPANIFRMLSITVKTFYVPMVLGDDTLLCLYNNDDTLSYSLLSNGAISRSEVSAALGEAVPFTPGAQEIEYAKVEFLSMMLTLKGASYIAKVNDVSFDLFNAPDHTVYFVPVHSMSFKYDGEQYTLMSLADVGFTGFTSNIPLPEDTLLTKKETKYKIPWISVALLIIVTLGITVLTVAAVVWVLTHLKIDIFLKIVLLGLPVYLLYALSTKIINFMSDLLQHIIMPLDRLVAEAVQKRAIQENFRQKRSDLSRKFSGKRVVFPEVSEIAQIDRDRFAAKYHDLMNMINNFSEKTLSI